MGLPGEVIIFNRYGGDTYSGDTVLPDAYVDYVKSIAEAPPEPDPEPGAGDDIIPKPGDDEED